MRFSTNIATPKVVAAVEPVRPHSPHSGADPVDLAAGAETGRGSREGESPDEEAERPAERREAAGVGERRRAEYEDADRVGEAGWARVLDRALADARLDELEVGEARKAPAPAQRQPDGELGGEQSEERPPAGREGDEGEEADHGLVEARRPGVDDVEIVVRVGGAPSLHFVKPTAEEA